MKTEYQIDDKAWCYLSGKPGIKVQGTVVHSFVLPNNNQRYYVLRFDGVVTDYLEVRDSFSMSDKFDEPLGYTEDIVAASGAVIGTKLRKETNHV
jgi:hypothetical protein